MSIWVVRTTTARAQRAVARFHTHENFNKICTPLQPHPPQPLPTNPPPPPTLQNDHDPFSNVVHRGDKVEGTTYFPHNPERTPVRPNLSPTYRSPRPPLPPRSSPIFRTPPPTPPCNLPESKPRLPPGPTAPPRSIAMNSPTLSDMRGPDPLRDDRARPTRPNDRLAIKDELPQGA